MLSASKINEYDILPLTDDDTSVCNKELGHDDEHLCDFQQQPIKIHELWGHQWCLKLK